MCSKVRSFLDLAAYYRRFIKYFSKLAADLTMKVVRFEWTKVYEGVLQELKMRLTLALILTIWDPDEIHVVYTDAYIVGLGCILMHNDKVVAYGPRKLEPHKHNCP